MSGGDKRYLGHREVVVVDTYDTFRLVRVHYAGETAEFSVDACALTDAPDYTSSISLGLLARHCKEAKGE